MYFSNPRPILLKIFLLNYTKVKRYFKNYLYFERLYELFEIVLTVTNINF